MDRASLDEPVAFVTLPDGRRMAYRIFGDPHGHPVLALHGTPGSRLKYRMADGAAHEAGLRLLSVDRWAYGLTAPHPSPSLAAFAEDARNFAEALDIAHFGVLGVSGGGPYAAAVAAHLPGRVSALALVAPVGPIAGERLLAMSAFHALSFRVLSRSPGAVRTVFGGFRALLDRNAPLALRIASARSAAVDRRTACQPYERQSLIDAFRAGLAPGTVGPAIDMTLFGRTWDVDLERIAAPARLWIGGADRHVPTEAARRLARRITGCSLIELPGAGHYWVMSHMPDVLGWMAEASTANGGAE